ncbi:hypothetical protein [Chitinophaga sp. Cy-1792]|uniref:hypothetical protein n=1 Tax=Chitinophaga sp. Cy-1792 TaxID=2608339 RepID=UPI00141F3EF6|nr:hypothetical protein [Chitinophaga sp. Cy-1792]NIG55079.1 hypothetical protein [Chitinophaga sp. Cy-1792]
MKYLSLLLIICSLIFLISCGGGNVVQKPPPADTAVSTNTVAMTVMADTVLYPACNNLWDSINNGIPLDTSQLIQMGLDNYTIRQGHSAGNRYYSLNDSLRVIILIYNDELVCSKRILVTYNTKANKGIEQLEVFSDCDQDDSTAYGRLEYKFENDSLLTVSDYTYAPGDGDQEHPEITEQRYKIQSDGHLLKIK